MSSPTPIITPPKKPKRFNWDNWTKRLTTLVTAVVALVTAVCGSVMAHYLTLTPEQQASWPWWVPLMLVVLPGAFTQLTPVAAAFRQFFAEDDTDQAGA